MTVYETIIALAAVFTLLGAHQAVAKLLSLLDGHLERFQAKLAIMMASQDDHNAKIDVILSKLL